MTRADITSRYVALVDTLADKTGRAHGWRRRVAAQLGINESTLSKILGGTRAVGMDLAERAVERLKLDANYFWGEPQTAQYKNRELAKEKETHASAITDLVERFDARTATVADIYALAHAVAEAPSVLLAQEILKRRKPKSEQEIGALFLAASKLVDCLR